MASKHPLQTLSEKQLHEYFDAYVELHRSYVRVVFGLFVGSLGQLVLYAFFLQGFLNTGVNRGLVLFAMPLAFVPFFLYFAVTFIRVPPPVLPETFRRILLFVAYWYLTSAAFLALVSALGFTSIRNRIETTIMWVIILSGCILAVPPILRCCKTLASLKPHEE